MENQMNVGNQNTQQIGQNPMSQSAKSPEKTKINYWMVSTIVLSIILIIVGVYFFTVIKPNLLSGKSGQQPQNNISSSSDLKQYTNSFYHVELDIPKDWTVKELKKDDGTPAFKLTSADSQISIETPLPDLRQEGTKSSNHIKQELDRTTVQLGEYSMPRSRYINDFDEIQDYISLYNIPYQKVVNLSFTVKGDYETNNQKLLSILKTFRFTQQEPSLDTFVSYQLPEGWKKEQRNPANETDDDSLSFVSSDYEPNIGMGINTGANLRVSKHLKDPRKTFMEIIKQTLPVPLENEAGGAKSVKIGAEQGFNLFTCWEGCYDGYYLEQGDYWWSINFSCAPDCSTRQKMDNSKYAKDRDIFLNSFKFK